MCIDDQMLSSYLDGELKEPYKGQVEEHLSYCKRCQNHLKELEGLSEEIKDLKVDSVILSRNKDKIFSALETKYFNSENTKRLYRRKIEMPFSAFITSAAALVFIFVGGFMFFGSNASQTEQILPSFSVNANSNNIQFVSQRTSNSLEQYSLDEILDYLESQGYEVDIRLKSIEPIEE